MDTQYESNRPFAPLSGPLIKLAGVNPERLAECPKRDIDNVLVIGWIMIGAWIWQSIVFSVTLHMIFSPTGPWNPALIGIALLLATVILLLDSHMVMTPTWSAHGLKELQRGGIEIPSPFLDRIKAGVSLGLRLAIATVSSLLIALFCSLQIFKQDIHDDLVRTRQAANQPVAIAAAERIDTQLRGLNEEHARLSRALEVLTTDERHFSQVVVDGGVEDSELRPLIDRVVITQQEKSAAEATLHDAESRAANEFGGTRTNDTSGVPGYGPRSQAARQRLSAAKSALEAKNRELTSLQSRISELRQAKREELDTRMANAKARLAAIPVERAKLEEQNRQVADTRADINARRADLIAKEIEKDPRTVAAETGFLNQVRTLWKISADPVIGLMTLIFDLFFLSIELAAVLSKLTTFLPSTYATRLARDDHFRQATEAHELANDLQSLVAGRSIPNDVCQIEDSSSAPEEAVVFTPADDVPDTVKPDESPATPHEPDGTILNEEVPPPEIRVQPVTNHDDDDIDHIDHTTANGNGAQPVSNPFAEHAAPSAASVGPRFSPPRRDWPGSSVEPERRGRGRPPGAKNKPKDQDSFTPDSTAA